ncbi:aldehyde dehydrogenase family protein [Plantactinospora sp. KLBMP9567]|uniref:aldehyde dehydrogenase family protein n=1 Tax=Plantactinospora sp. KLBMP9567 TaxID=3085900 RepID=UPI002980E6C9|nr:aldehyde dehydrogenase family protein [Plantactinospora sp. KLBMP9567]MDW5329531.1 aldehyde dehydrogenase family protein [Plantactinospora sp. KLBMP9567]
MTRDDILRVENPATGGTLAEIPVPARPAVDRTVADAAAALPDWSGRTVAERAAHLLRCNAALGAHVEEMARLLTLEQGKPLADARAEVRLAVDWFRHTAELSLEPERVEDAGARILIGRVPHGVVAALAPSNYPVILATTKIAPALLAGNTAVLKPSPLTPLATMKMIEVLGGELPPGALAVTPGDGELGRTLVAHPNVAMISFTGSVATGRAIAGQAASRFAPVVLELGGNDPAIVLPGADVAAVAEDIYWAAMRNSGQFCAAVKRVYVPDQHRAELVDALDALAGSTVVGDGLEPETQLGPLVSAAQLDRLDTLVAEARGAGARIVTGGKRQERAGHFYPPTIITDLPAGTGLELTEQFGPALPVLGYDDLAEAVARANSTEFGLGGSVWGDEELARNVAGRLDCGTVWVNTHGQLRADVPFGGVRSSGSGVEYGYWGLLEYTRIKVSHTAIRTGV